MNAVHAIANLLRRGTLVVSLLAFVLSGLVGVSLVLCVGGDGHVAIESVQSQPHPLDSAPFAPGSTNLSAGPDSCVDRPVIETAPKPGDVPVAPLLAFVCLLWALVPPPGLRLWPLFQRLARDPRLDHHRTVVLLN